MTSIPATFLAAPAQAPTIQGGHIGGAMTLSAVSLLCGVVMVAAWRGSKRLALLRTPDGAVSWAIVTGNVWMAAGASWASTAAGIASIPASAVGGQDSLGAGGVSLVLTALAYFWPWKKALIVPIIIGIGAGVTYTAAGGIWNTVPTAIRMIASHFTGGA